MSEKPKTVLPSIPAKRYFTIGEVSDLCMVKPHVLRYWEQEFTQLRPMKRRGNRRYYQHHEVLLVRRIRDLLYEQGFTISGARNQLGDRVDDDEPHLPEVFSNGARASTPPQMTLRQTTFTNANAQSLQGSDLFLESLPTDIPQARKLLQEAMTLLS